MGVVLMSIWLVYVSLRLAVVVHPSSFGLRGDKRRVRS